MYTDELFELCEVNGEFGPIFIAKEVLETLNFLGVQKFHIAKVVSQLLEFKGVSDLPRREVVFDSFAEEFEIIFSHAAGLEFIIFGRV